MEFRRIKELPRREFDAESVPDLTPLFARPDGKWTLRPIQSFSLLEMERMRGAFLAVPVGKGKTLIGLLSARALRAERLVYVTRASLVDVIKNVEIPKYGEQFDLPLERLVAVISYDDLSSPKNPFLLHDLNPDAFFFDEANELRHLSSVKCSRVREYLKANPRTRIVVASGTFSSGRLRDWAHLAWWALRDQSPVPRPKFHNVLEDWACALDAQAMDYVAPGKLLELCDHDHGTEDPTSMARHKFCCRLVASPGVVSLGESALDVGLEIEARYPEVPSVVEQALKEFRETWQFGEMIAADALGFYRIANQLAMGFYYEPVWSDGVPDRERLVARRQWAAFVRMWLAHHKRPGIDSEWLLLQAIRDGRVKVDGWDYRFWQEWEAALRRPKPGKKTIWLSSFIRQDIQDWMQEGDNGIVWYRDQAIEEGLAPFLPVFGAGRGTELAQATRASYPYLCASIKAHYKGQNLQPWNRNLVVGMLGAEGFEQLLARTHREGQEEKVQATVYLHTEELRASFDKARATAKVIETTMGGQQKLNLAKVKV